MSRDNSAVFGCSRIQAGPRQSNKHSCLVITALTWSEHFLPQIVTKTDADQWFNFSRHNLKEIPHSSKSHHPLNTMLTSGTVDLSYGLFTLRKPCSPLILNGQWAFLRVNILPCKWWYLAYSQHCSNFLFFVRLSPSRFYIFRGRKLSCWFQIPPYWHRVESGINTEISNPCMILYYTVL